MCLSLDVTAIESEILLGVIVARSCHFSGNTGYRNVYLGFSNQRATLNRYDCVTFNVLKSVLWGQCLRVSSDN